MGKNKTIQEVLNSVHNLSNYDGASFTGGGGGTTWTKEAVAETAFTSGDLTMSASNPAREVHIHSPNDFSVYINDNADAKEIALESTDSPFVINNMDVTSLYITVTLAAGEKIKIQAYYE